MKRKKRREIYETMVVAKVGDSRKSTADEIVVFGFLEDGGKLWNTTHLSHFVSATFVQSKVRYGLCCKATRRYVVLQREHFHNRTNTIPSQYFSSLIFCIDVRIRDSTQTQPNEKKQRNTFYRQV